MADKMIFPIGFDLAKAVEDAASAWDSKYAGQLESRFSKRSIEIGLTVNPKSFDSLDAVKKRLGELKIEPITPETKTAIKELAAELRTLAKALEQVQKYSISRSAASPDAVRSARIAELEAKREVQLRKAEEAAAKAAKKELELATAREKAANSADKLTTKVKTLTQAYNEQSSYLGRLLQRMVTVWSLQRVKDFLTNIREVTAQFELQRVSLGAIIQDQNRANQLFGEIKNFALKSPVSILDLTKYTKQVAAYRIETDKLFDTTKRLADVSVGLGVDMGRIVLAYGQVKAASYLRAAEIRQFTEAGIPMLELLAEKFTKLNGEAVSTEQVMDMVSKRMVEFGMVEQIFNDMTSAGGMFYNMQEKQGNTLYGLWAKLGDAASVMYDEIGNTESVNDGMRTAIQLLTDLMRNWKAVANTVVWTGVPAVAIAGLVRYSFATDRQTAANKAAESATKNRIAAVLALNDALEKGTVDEINAANAALKKAQADEAAATKNASKLGLLKSGFASLAKSFASGLGIGIAIAAVTTVIYKLFEAYENANRLNNKLKEIESQRIIVTEQSVRNFERLADSAVRASDGSVAQKEALDELHRTFKNMIPEEDMSIENLKKLRAGAESAADGYKNLTEAIKHYINEQQRQLALSSVKDEYGAEIIEMSRNLRRNLEGMGFSENESARFVVELEKQADVVGKDIRSKIEDAFKGANLEFTDAQIDQILSSKSGWRKALDNTLKYSSVSLMPIMPNTWYFSNLGTASDVERLNESLYKQSEYIKGINEQYAVSSGLLPKYEEELKRVRAATAEYVPKNKDGGILDEDTWAYAVAKRQKDIQGYGEVIVTALREQNIAIDKEWFNPEFDPNKNNYAAIASLNMDKIIKAIGNKSPELKKLLQSIKNEYDNLVPNDAVVVSVRNKFISLADSMGLMDKVKNNLMSTGETLEDYRKKINTTAKEYAQQVKNLTNILAFTPFASKKYKELAEKLEGVKDLADLYAQWAKLLGETTTGAGRQSDSRLQNLKEEISLTKKLWEEYQQLEKQIGKTRAKAEIAKLFPTTIKNLQDKARGYGFEFKTPFSPEEYKSNLRGFIARMEVLAKEVDKKGKPKFSTIAKDIEEAKYTLEHVDLDDLQKATEKKIKELADRVSRTKTAKQFYEKILGQTGDVNLAASVTFSAYGQDGRDLQEQIADQVRTLVGETPVKLPADIISGNNKVDYHALHNFVEKNRLELGAVAATLDTIADNGEKELAQVMENAAKLLLEYDEIAQQRVNIEQEASNKIKELREAEAHYLESETNTDEEKKAYSKRTNRAVAGVEAGRDLELMKLSDQYMRFFSSVHAMTEEEARLIRRDVRAALYKAFRDGKLSASQLNKELKSVDEQFYKLINDVGNFRTFLSGGFDGLLERMRGIADEAQSVTSELVKMKDKGDTIDKEGWLWKDGNKTDTRLSEGQRKFIDQYAKMFGDDNTGRSFEQMIDKTGGNVSKMGDNFGQITESIGGMTQGFSSALAVVDMIIKAVDSTIQGVAQIRDQLNAMRSDDNQLEGWGWDAFEYLENFNQYAASGWEKLKNGDIAGAVTDTVSSIISIFGTAQAQKVKRLNKEIEKQQDILDELSYSYGRLQTAADKALGSDFVNNINRQLSVLQAQAKAYEKQAELERAKGKGTDKDKLKEYEDAYRDTMDEIADMQGTIAEKMLGSDLASAARDFAQAWLDAYKEFSSTADAMSEKFQEMIENMVVESALAKVMERALQPMFDMIDNASEQDFYSDSFWREVADKAKSGADAANSGAASMMSFFEQAGISVRSLGGELTGISRDIASASEESITGLAAGINTQNYYISQQLVEVQAIRALLEAGASPLSADGAGLLDLIALETQSMGHLSAISRNTAETVAECRRIAVACEEQLAYVKRVVAPKGTKGAYAVQTSYN